jgi:hypothetical protein
MPISREFGFYKIIRPKIFLMWAGIWPKIAGKVLIFVQHFSKNSCENDENSITKIWQFWLFFGGNAGQFWASCPLYKEGVCLGPHFTIRVLGAIYICYWGPGKFAKA